MAKNARKTTKSQPTMATSQPPGPKPGSGAETPTPAAERRGPGRPPGPTDTRPAVAILPPQCTRCQSTIYTVTRRIITRPIAGVIDGRPYDQVTWRRLRCQCGQLYTARFYEFSGTRTKC